MKFSRREQKIIAFMKKYPGQNFSFEQLMEEYEPKSPKKHFKLSMIYTLRRLREKLEVEGIKLERTSLVGRGHKGIFWIDEKILNL